MGDWNGGSVARPAGLRGVGPAVPAVSVDALGIGAEERSGQEAAFFP